uniref:Zn(2)-C6 fungal-type domain-containing protein n=1 Tax=Kwoniella pini CBS 10737 TaxID=1296096 RepID=A0A1B9ID78_9TREE|nr:uncharacterized protein I206_00934 [Kwoniella pini CBS 10737]OCF53628.1 hypothetical protein I206_00934 [Kwoniella pini CBS 10737]
MTSPAHNGAASTSTDRESNGDTPARPAIASTGIGRITPRSACEPCRTRKIKCTGERPTCARCQKQGKECIYANATTSWSYIAALEERIRGLEGERAQWIGQQDPEHSNKRQRLDGSTPPELPPSPSLQRRFSSGGGSGTVHPPERQAMINELPSVHPVLIPFDRSALPPPQHIHELLSHFFLYTNAAFPLFHIPTLQRQVDVVCFSDDLVNRSDLAAVLFALAIGAASLFRTSPLHSLLSPRAESFFHMAMRFTMHGVGFNSLARLQIQVAHLIFVLYNPNAGNAWDLAGAAARHALGMGLHHEWDDQVKTPLEREMGRRLFWITYSLDVMMCVVVARPPVIPDQWINAELPSIYDDSLITDTTIHAGDLSPLKAASLQVYRLRRIQCEILTRLHASKSPPATSWFETMTERLDQWLVICPEGAGYANSDWQTLHYHASISMLHRPSRANPTPDREAVTKALISSREVLRRSKDMYRMGRVNFNWLTMHNLFIQGVTYLNCLWQSRQNGWNIVPSSVDAFLDVHVCSSLMEGVAAITPGTSGIRNAFEAVSEKVIRQVMSSNERQTSPIHNNPLEVFLVHPLGDMNGDEWDRTVAVVLQRLP